MTLSVTSSHARCERGRLTAGDLAVIPAMAPHGSRRVVALA